uniref:Uncharacterized protein n=1 Tax=Arundo donax TaxID=35708 RepID=A0A0A9FKC8_ARUDO
MTSDVFRDVALPPTGSDVMYNGTSCPASTEKVTGTPRSTLSSGASFLLM